jgi:hypothetical protein
MGVLSFFVGQWSSFFLPSFPFLDGCFLFYLFWKGFIISSCFEGFNNHGVVGSLKTI